MATVDAFLPAIVDAVLRAQAEGGRHESRNSRTIDERQFRRMQPFNGHDKEWRDWSFHFRAALREDDLGILEVAN